MRCLNVVMCSVGETAFIQAFATGLGDVDVVGRDAARFL
jgi:hypothetical protein